MDGVFLRVLELSLWGSVMIGAVLVLRLILNRAPKRAICLLWLLAVLRLLVPFEIAAPWSIQPKVELGAIAATEPVDGYFQSTQQPQTVQPELLEQAITYPLQEIPIKRTVQPMEVLGWVWLAGVVILSGYGLFSYLRLKKRVGNAVILEEGVWISAGLDTAFVLGFFRPQIYLTVLGDGEREFVLLHERCHIRRLDHWWKLAAFAAVAVHWFNPLAWVTYVLLCRDMEIACDQETVRGMDNARRKAYSEALLRCAARQSGIAACPVAFGEISVKERIVMILKYKKPGFWVTLIAVIAAAAVGIFLLTSPGEDGAVKKCRLALAQWQELEHLHLHQRSDHAGDLALNSWAETDYWTSGDAALLRDTADLTPKQETWLAYQDGEIYRRTIILEDGWTEDSVWYQPENPQSRPLPWVLGLDWDAWQTKHVKTVRTDGGEEVHLTMEHPESGVCQVVFSFEGETLCRVVRSISESQPDPKTGEMLSSDTVQTFTLESTDRTEIERQIMLHGHTLDLERLYKELDAIQNASSLYMVIDSEIDSNYDVWDTCCQEFWRSGSDWHRKFAYQTSSGSFVTEYFYDSALYARETSADGAVPNRDWEIIEDRGFGRIDILTRNWRELEVLDIQRDRDGSAIIILQMDLTPTADTVYHEKTYTCHLDHSGRLIKLVLDAHYTKEISERYAQGTFEFRERGTITFPNMTKEKIEAHLLEMKLELTHQQYADIG